MTAPQLIRSFIAVNIDPQVRKSLIDVQNQLKKSGADVKWVNPEQFHFTLKFLGENTSAKTQLAAQLIQPIFEKAQPFTATINVVGVFPPSGRPQVIWAGLADPLNHLKNLAEGVENKLEAIGFPREKRNFQAHLTLGRVRREKYAGQLQKFLANMPPFKTILVELTSIAMYQSTLTTSGSIYTALKTYPLGG